MGSQIFYQQKIHNFLPLYCVYASSANFIRRIEPQTPSCKGLCQSRPNPRHSTLRNHSSVLSRLLGAKKRQSQGSWWKEKQWRPTTSHAPEQMTFRLWEEAQFFSSVFCSVSRLALRCYFHLFPVVTGRSNVSAGVWLSERPRALCWRNHRRPCREISRVHALARLTAAPIISN
jgi:hypothetical protein